MMCIHAHIGIPRNKMVDGVAKDGTKSGLYYPSNAPVMHYRMKPRRDGKYPFSIPPRVQFHLWSHGLEADRPFITVVSHLILELNLIEQDKDSRRGGVRLWR
jgi:hypothetical protein